MKKIRKEKIKEYILTIILLKLSYFLLYYSYYIIYIILEI